MDHFHQCFKVKEQLSFTEAFERRTGFEVRNYKLGDHHYKTALWYSLRYSEFIIEAAAQHKSLCVSIREEPRWVIKGGLLTATHRAWVQTLFWSLSKSFTSKKLLYPCKYFTSVQGPLVCVNGWKKWNNILNNCKLKTSDLSGYSWELDNWENLIMCLEN